MKITIDAMKRALEVLKTLKVTEGYDQYRCSQVAITLLSEAIKREEAQTVEPYGYLGWNYGKTHKTLFLGPAPNGETELFSRPVWAKSSGERDAVITQHRARAESAKLRGPNYSPCISADELLVLLDMLAADALEISGWRADQKENLSNQMELQKQINDLKVQQVAVPQLPFGAKRKAAMAIYSPPFRFMYGYVYDSKNHMVADQAALEDEKHSVKGAVALQIRGWGRIGYMPNAPELQDEVGAMVVDALNAYYSREVQP